MNKPEIVSILEKEGVELRQRGWRLWACCPLHSERTASFSVDVEKQKFHCFGCHVSGDVLDFIRAYKGISFQDALAYLNISKNKSNYPHESRKRKLLERYSAWERNYCKKIADVIRVVNKIDLLIATPQDMEIPGIEDVYLKKEIYQHHLSILNSNDIEAKFQLFREVICET